MQDNQVVAVGAASLPIVPGMTSADAEIEGLIMGLDFACGLSLDDEEQLLVEGDCKAVIDAMTGAARPRKLERTFNLVSKSLEGLNILDVRFRHIPRSANTLCDVLCEKVIDFTIQQALNELSCELSKGSILITDILVRFFGGSSVISYSRRPSLYFELYQQAVTSRDGLAVINIGRHLEVDARAWPPCNHLESELCRQFLAGLAIQMQIRGHEMMGDSRLALRLRQKHRRVLQEVHVVGASAILFRLTSNLVKDDVLVGSSLSSDGERKYILEEWLQKARAEFLTGKSLRKERCQVWVTR
jgi:ribonuclease HI